MGIKNLCSKTLYKAALVMTPIISLSNMTRADPEAQTPVEQLAQAVQTAGENMAEAQKLRDDMAAGGIPVVNKRSIIKR